MTMTEHHRYPKAFLLVVVAFLLFVTLQTVTADDTNVEWWWNNDDENRFKPYYFKDCPISLNLKINKIALTCDRTYEIVDIIKISDDEQKANEKKNPKDKYCKCNVKDAKCVCNPNVRKPAKCSGPLVQAVNATSEDNCPIQVCACVPGASKDSSGRCRCIHSDAEYDAATNSCKKKCDESEKLQNGQCVPKCDLATQVYNYARGECEPKCDAGFKYDPVTKKCVSKCTADQVYDPKTNTCVTKPVCNYDQRYDAELIKCINICQVGEVYDKEEKVCHSICKPDEVYDKEEDCCVPRCASTHTWVDGKCVPNCQPYEIIQNGKCVCNEQSGQVCGTNGKTYVSRCALERAKATFASNGACTTVCTAEQPDQDSMCLTKCPPCKDPAFTLTQQFTQQGCVDECLCINRERKCVTQDAQVDTNSSQSVMNRLCCTKIKSYDSVTNEEFKPVKGCSQTKCITSKIDLNSALKALFL